MTTSLILACVWALVACVAAMLPSKDHHWRVAYVLIATGLPLLAYVTWENGLLVGALCLLAAASLLRYPVLYALRWLRERLRRG